VTTPTTAGTSTCRAASFERECDEKRPDGSVHLHGRYRRGAYVEPTCRRLGVRLVETT